MIKTLLVHRLVTNATQGKSFVFYVNQKQISLLGTAFYNSIQKLLSNQNYLVSRSTIVDIYPGNQRLQITKLGSMTRSYSSMSHNKYHTVYRQNSPLTPPCSPSVVLSILSLWSTDSLCSYTGFSFPSKKQLYLYLFYFLSYFDSRNCAFIVTVFVVNVHNHVIVVSVVQVFLFFL